jgi:hypothetical protein
MYRHKEGRGREAEQGLTEPLRQARYRNVCTMMHIKRHRLWTVSTTIAVLCFFAAGTGLACMRREVGTVLTAQECCQGYCQHAVEAEAAMQCCQSQRASVSQVLPIVASSKTIPLAVEALPIAVMPPAVGQTAKQLQVPFSSEGRLPRLYALHCALLR